MQTPGLDFGQGEHRSRENASWRLSPYIFHTRLLEKNAAGKKRKRLSWSCTNVLMWCNGKRVIRKSHKRNLDCKTVRIFAHSSTREQSNKRSGTRLKTENETVSLSLLSPHTAALRACKTRALRARKARTSRFTDFFTDYEKKTDCFAV